MKILKTLDLRLLNLKKKKDSKTSNSILTLFNIRGKEKHVQIQMISNLMKVDNPFVLFFHNLTPFGTWE